jgi:hypothetical protein
MKFSRVLTVTIQLIAALTAGTLWASEIVCPDLSTAIQVGACPSEEELKFTFDGYCSDNARMYDKPEEQLCASFQLYRALKNYALWEAADGEFAGYVSCDPLKHPLAQAKPIGVKVSKQGSITRIACAYDNAVAFTYRGKQQCFVSAETTAQCAQNPAACKAQCD